ncbi:hypothetical protein ES702_02979 [subsurface metagenome]
MISEGEAIFYIEYLDHARSPDLNRLESNPVVLWCTGKIAQESNEFLALLCSGVKNEMPTSHPTYEIILKSAITIKELIHIVK